MPRPKKYENATQQKMAWASEKTSRIVLDIRDDSALNKAVLQKAADALNLSVARLLTEAAGEYIVRRLGEEWVEENGNRNKNGKED